MAHPVPAATRRREGGSNSNTNLAFDSYEVERLTAMSWDELIAHACRHKERAQARASTYTGIFKDQKRWRAQLRVKTVCGGAELDSCGGGGGGGGRKGTGKGRNAAKKDLPLSALARAPRARRIHLARVPAR